MKLFIFKYLWMKCEYQWCVYMCVNNGVLYKLILILTQTTIIYIAWDKNRIKNATNNCILMCKLRLLKACSEKDCLRALPYQTNKNGKNFKKALKKCMMLLVVLLTWLIWHYGNHICQYFYVGGWLGCWTKLIWRDVVDSIIEYFMQVKM